MAARNSCYKLAQSYCFLQSQRRCFSTKQFPWSSTNSNKLHLEETNSGTQDDAAGIGRSLSDVLKDLNKKVPESLIKLRTQPDGFSAKYIPWFFFFLSLYDSLFIPNCVVVHRIILSFWLLCVECFFVKFLFDQLSLMILAFLKVVYSLVYIWSFCIKFNGRILLHLKTRHK